MPGSWTLLVVSEDDQKSKWYTRRCKALRYTLVMRDADTGALVVCSPSEFYSRTTGLQRDDEVDEYIPGPIKGRVEECKYDEVEEIAGRFLEKRNRLMEATP